jgi:hypothetical protein
MTNDTKKESEISLVGLYAKLDALILNHNIRDCILISELRKLQDETYQLGLGLGCKYAIDHLISKKADEMFFDKKTKKEFRRVECRDMRTRKLIPIYVSGPAAKRLLKGESLNRLMEKEHYDSTFVELNVAELFNEPGDGSTSWFLPQK